MFPSLNSNTGDQPKIHNYVLGEVIGKGTFSTIRTAYVRGEMHPYAIKIIPKKRLEMTQRRNQIMLNETVLAPLLSHPNIIQVHDIIESESHIFQVMTRATSGDMLRRLRLGPLNISSVYQYMGQLFSSIEYLHSLGICHRDIKLENMLLNKNQNLKLCDFGFSTISFDGILGDNCGSVDYYAPEVVEKSRFDGFKADMWSCGVVCYALFCRRLPYTAEDRSDNYIRDVDYSEVPDDAAFLIRSLLSLDPLMRPSAAEARLILGNNGNAIHPVPISISDDCTDPGKFANILSILSQLTKIPIYDIQSSISSDSPSVLSLLFMLVKQKLEKPVYPKRESRLFRNQNRHSAPASYPNSTPVNSSVTFNAPSSLILDHMKDYLLVNKCIMSSPISGNPSIVFNGKTNDKHVYFSFYENLQDRSCTLNLLSDQESSDISDSTIRYLQRRFNLREV